jgi:zinc transporter 2
MLQSVGVIIASIIIYFWEEASIADPICTYAFSILVIVTTIPVFRDCIRVLMESSPSQVPVDQLQNEILKVQGVKSVDDLHVWMLAGSKNAMTCHIKLKKVNDTEILRVHNEVSKIISKYEICHKTIQIL